MDTQRVGRVLGAIDQLNRGDPNHDIVNGVPHPRELLHAERVTAWVLRLNAQASEALRIAARGQHVRRWTIPRDRYPMTRQGYLRWRETLKAYHAETVGELMRREGYPSAEIERVRLIMSKRRLPDDLETQTLEDALCLVFLETQFADLRRKTTEETMTAILRKTWAKMSARARTAALELPLGEPEQRLIAQALGSLS